MSDNSAIEWTDATWNPVRGCTKVSAGCKNCYAETFAERWRGIKGHPFEQGFDLRLVPESLAKPVRWKEGRKIFVNSMSDLFHEEVPDWYVMRVWMVMARCPQHTFQILTKRPERMLAWLRKWSDNNEGEPNLARGPEETRAAHPSGRGAMFADVLESMGTPPPGAAYPTFDWMEGPRWLPDVLPNVHLGVSCEDQPNAGQRIPLLRLCPAPVLFVSFEPLLGPIVHDLKGIDWAIIGGESGAGARPMDLSWARSLVTQAKLAGVRVFVKQLGARPTEGAWVPVKLRSRKGGDPSEWPGDLRIREFPEVAA